MKKVWFFVEGDSEENFTINLMRNKYNQNFLLEKDLLTFVTIDLTNSTHHLFHIENCHSINKIPHQVNLRAHLINNYNISDMIIVCDLEDQSCFSNRKNVIDSALHQSINKNNIKYIISNPYIEANYWDCEDLIKQVLKKEFRLKFDIEFREEVELVHNHAQPLYSIKKSFEKYKLKYRESRFSESFFPRVDFNTCQNLTLKRIISKFDSL